MSTETHTRSRFQDYFVQWRETISENLFSYLLLLPTVLFLIFLMWLPFFRGVYMSFHEWPFIGEPTWIGLDNYRYLFGWEAFRTSLKATVIYGLGTVIQLILAILAALLVKDLKRFKSSVSGAMLIPYTMAPVVTGTIWLYLLNPSIGPIFTYLTNNGLLSQPIFWNVNGSAAIMVVTLVMAWTFWPFMFLIILANLESIPEEHYETGKVYGASRWQRFRYITYPQIKSAILIAVSIRIIWNLVKISQPLQMTGGGPGYDTSILAILLYRFAYNDGAMGIGYAVGMILLIITSVFALIFIREFNRTRQGVNA